MSAVGQLNKQRLSDRTTRRPTGRNGGFGCRARPRGGPRPGIFTANQGEAACALKLRRTTMRNCNEIAVGGFDDDELSTTAWQERKTYWLA